MEPIDYYFAYRSPYAFLANTRINQILQGHDVELRPKPLAPTDDGGAPVFSASKLAYIKEDIRRMAKTYGLTLKAGPSTETQSASQGYLFAAEHGTGEPYNTRIFQARWCERKDIADPTVLMDIASQCGLDPEAFISATQSPEYKAKLDEIKHDAGQAGVFGVPFFIYKGQKFWGNDRIEYLVDALT